MGRTGRSPVMIGRSGELDRLARLLASRTTPAVALIGGEAGIGKTRLVQELSSRVGDTACVLVGQADPGALGRPMELLLAAVEDEADADDDLLALAADRTRPADERVRAGHELVHRIIGGRPAVVVFEDLHWADSESVALFERLADPDNGPLLLVGTYRPDSLSRRHPTAELLPRLERRVDVTRLRLDRLSPAEVSDFLTVVFGQAPSYRVVEDLHTRTGGNPFFLEELLGAAGDTDPEEMCAQPLPWSLSELVRAQLDDLEPAERRVVDVAAVLGRRVSFDLLAAVTQCTEEELIEVLRSLVQSGMLVEAESDVFTFHHALAREAVEAELLGRERRRLHEAALEALTAAAGDAPTAQDLAAIARHAQGAGRYDDLVDAARRGSMEYLRLASPYQALQLAELGLTEADDDPKLLAVASRAAWLTGLLPDAEAYVKERIERAQRANDVEDEVAARRLGLRVIWELGDVDELEARTAVVEDLVARMDQGEERGRAMASLAQSYMLREQTDVAVAWADRALEVAAELDLPDLRVSALVEKGSALAFDAAKREEGANLLYAVADDAEAIGEWVVVGRALHNIVRTDARPNDPILARQLLERMRSAARRGGLDSLATAAYAEGMAEMGEWEGDLDAALTAISEGRHTMRGDADHPRGSWFSVHEAGLLLEANEVDRAASAIREPSSVGTERRIGYLGLAAHVAARRGDLATARVEIKRLRELLDDVGKGHPHLVHDVVSAGLQAGLGPDELRPVVERAGIQGKDAAADSAWQALLGAQLAEAEGRLEESLGRYLEALAPAPSPFFPYIRGTAHVGAARALIGLGRLDEAAAHADAAADALARWRGWRVAELAAVQRRLGRGTHAVAGPAELTPREREVAALLGEGLSNAELAERLFISPKTAAVHVSNILAKLGMGSRAEVTAYAVREGLRISAE